MITQKERKLLGCFGVSLDIGMGFVLSVGIAMAIISVLPPMNALIYAPILTICVFAGTPLLAVAWNRTIGTEIIFWLTVRMVRGRQKEALKRRLKDYVRIGADNGQD